MLAKTHIARGFISGPRDQLREVRKKTPGVRCLANQSDALQFVTTVSPAGLMFRLEFLEMPPA